MVPDPPWNRPSITRRGFLGTAGVAGTAAVIRPGPKAATSSLSPRQRDMVLAVAGVASVFPVHVAAATAASSARAGARPRVRARFANPTTARVLAASSRLSGSRLALAQDGSDALLAAGLLGQSQAKLLDGMAGYAGSAAGRARLSALVTLAISAWSGQSGADCENQAGNWTGILARLHERGSLGHIATLRGIQ
jgi:hypothetical protein